MMVTQHPKTPKEAFLRNEGAVFPAVELYNVLAKLKADDRYKNLGTPGSFYEEEGKVRFKPDLVNKLFPLTKFPTNPTILKRVARLYINILLKKYLMVCIK